MTELTPQQISVSFVTQYYFILSSNTKNLYKFYKNESEMTHEHSTVVKQLPGNINPNAAVGAEIEKKISTLGYEECKVKLTYVDSQRSLNGAVFVFVEGVMTRQVDQKEMNFTQTFLLAEQENGYFVRNDYLRFIPDASSNNTTTVQASATQNPPVAESSTTTSVISTTSSSEHHSKSQNGHQLSFSLNSSTVNIVSTTNGSHSPRSEASSTAATAGASSVYGGAAEEENQLEDEAEEEEIKVPEKKPQQTQQPTQAKSTTSVPAENKEPHGTISYAAAASGRDYKNESEQQTQPPKHKSGKKHNKENKEHKNEQHKTEKTENKEHKTTEQHKEHKDHKEHKEHKEHKNEHHKNDHKKPTSAPTGEPKQATAEKKEKTFRGKDHPLNKHAIYVRDLPVGTKDTDLKDAFSTYGSIIDINNKSGKDQSYNKYALIFFEKQQSVDEVLKNPTVTINDHQCPITKYQRKPKQFQRAPNQPTTPNTNTPKTETTTPTTNNTQQPRSTNNNRVPRQKYARATSNEGESEKK